MIELLQTSVIAAGLILPGWGWARRWDEGVLVAMIVSWLALFSGVLFATFCNISLSREFLIGGQVLVGGAGVLFARRSGVRDWGIKWDLRLGWGWLALPVVIVAVWKAVAQPLSGSRCRFPLESSGGNDGEDGRTAVLPADNRSRFSDLLLGGWNSTSGLEFVCVVLPDRG